MNDVIISSGAEVYYSIIDSESVIFKGAIVGKKHGSRDEITVVAQGSSVGLCEYI